MDFALTALSPGPFPGISPTCKRNPIFINIAVLHCFFLSRFSFIYFESIYIMPSPPEKAVLAAIQDVENGVSQRQAAERHRIPRSTLRHRLNGGQSPRKAHEGKQRLSKEQEEHLVTWIVVQESLGLTVTHQQVRELAERVLKASGDNQSLGKRWTEHFLQRNPKARTKRGKLMDSKRVNGGTIIA
jgi:transposase